MEVVEHHSVTLLLILFRHHKVVSFRFVAAEGVSITNFLVTLHPTSGMCNIISWSRLGLFSCLWYKNSSQADSAPRHTVRFESACNTWFPSCSMDFQRRQSEITG